MGLDQYFYKTKKSISEKDIQELLIYNALIHIDLVSSSLNEY